MRSKAKFDKNICIRCKYHGRGKQGFSAKCGNTYTSVFCDYANITDSTCLKRTGKGEIIDMRGEDYSDCKLFSPGRTEHTDFKHFRV